MDSNGRIVHYAAGREPRFQMNLLHVGGVYVAAAGPARASSRVIAESMSRFEKLWVAVVRQPSSMID
eukprot:366569-Chlamydomonas_euryale.AAC.12